MKIACLISGLPRSFNNNISNIKEIFNNVDFFVHITTDYTDNYNNIDINYEEYIKELNPVVVIKEKDPKFKKNKFINIKKQWYKFTSINNIKKNYENSMNIKYDIVIRLRPDIFILSNNIVFNNIEEGVIYGNNDEFFYGSSNTIDIFSDIIFSFDNMKNITKKTDFFFEYLKLQNIRLQNIDFNYKLILTQCNIIGITGDSGTGKTTLIKYLDKIFKNETLKIEGDRYHKWERNDKNWNNFTHLNPEANYICKFQEDIFNLKIGETIYQVDYDHSTGKFTEKEKIKSSQNILVCGLHTLYNTDTNKLFNLKIFLDTENKLKYNWKIKRDVKERGYSKQRVLENISLRENDNIKFIEPQKKKSDITIKFFTDINFDYKNIDITPNIYLKISSKKNIIEFMTILDKYNIDYNISRENIYHSIIFYKIFNFKPVLFEFIKNEIELFENNYYTIIIAFILFYNEK